MTVRIAIDLNVRVRGGQTFSSLDDADGPVAAGDQVLAVEEETGIRADAVVAAVYLHAAEIARATMVVTP